MRDPPAGLMKTDFSIHLGFVIRERVIALHRSPGLPFLECQFLPEVFTQPLRVLCLLLFH
jgi:hypothetical protein